MMPSRLQIAVEMKIEKCTVANRDRNACHTISQTVAAPQTKNKSGISDFGIG
jgi:hypothetical protein